MSNAPEHILSWPWPDKPHQGLWHVSPFDRDGATEYVRLDAHEAAVAAARKEGMLASVVSSINDLVAWLESDADNIHFLPADDVQALREWLK